MRKNSPQAPGETPEERVAAFKKSLGCFFYKPYPWQERLHKVIREKTTVAAISSNKIGKCITYGTLVDTPEGPIAVGTLFHRGKPFDVYAWDGEKKVIAKAHPPFKKYGLHSCYRIMMSDLSWVEVADHHRILTTSGAYTSACNLYDSFLASARERAFVDCFAPESYSIPARTTLDAYQSVPSEGAQSSFGIRSDYWGRYSENFHQYDGLLPKGQDSGPTSVPLQADAPTRSAPESHEDGPESRYKHISQPSSCRPSSLCDRLRRAALSVESLFRNACTSLSPTTCGPQGFAPPDLAGVSGPLPTPEAVPRVQRTVPSCDPLCIDDNRIISYNFIGLQEVYDFTVPKFHNYCAGGLVHHNTADVVNIGISWLLGYEPWSPLSKDDPEAVLAYGSKDQYYRRSSLGIAPPVNIIMTGEDWKLHIGRVIVPEWKKWAPVGWYHTKKNEQGVEYFWEWNNKSTLTIMSYSQDDDLFESFRAQGVIMDEPPPKSKYAAMSRGLLLDCGKTLLSLTPLKEAWILDEIVLSGRRDIGIVDKLNITDNPDLYNSDLAMLGEMGLDEIQKKRFFDLLLYSNIDRFNEGKDKEKKPVEDRGRKAGLYLEQEVPPTAWELISKLKIMKFIADIDPADVPPRVFGMFKALVGRVLKKFDKDIHMIEPFSVPTDWPVVPMIDFHLSTPQMISYWTVNKQDVNYCIAETWENFSGDEIADDIIKKKNLLSMNITEAFIDPLSKGDTAYMKNRIGSDLKDTYSIIEEKLAEHGITLYVASKDKDSGIKNLEKWIEGPNKLPTMYVFNTCERFLYEVQRWVYDEDGKPIKENDHAMECAYRYSLVGNSYKNHVVNPLPHRNYAGTGAWLGA